MSDGVPEMITLYCVGCGRAVVQAHPRQRLAIACGCGASAPVLCSRSGAMSLPLSLVLAELWGGPVPHLEYYLGTSDHTSETKTLVTAQLRSLGAISYAECTDARCRESSDRSRQFAQGKG